MLNSKTTKQMTSMILSLAVLPLPGMAQAIEREGQWNAPAKQEKQVSRRTFAPAGAKARMAGIANNNDGRPVKVVVVYKHQPQAAIMEQLESLAAPQRELAVAQLSRSTGHKEAEAHSQEKLDAITMSTRAAAMQAIEAEIGPMQEEKAARLEAAGATNIRRHLMMNVLTAEVTPQALAQLEADEDVAEVHPAPRLHTMVANSEIDPTVGVLGMAAWWNAGLTGNGQQIVVLDTGINATHPIFAGKQVVARAFLQNIRKDSCFADDADSGRDLVGHGSHVAGIAAGASETLLSTFQGTAPGVNRIFALKVGARLSGRGDCGDNAFDIDDILDGITFALNNTTAKIYNMSFGADTTEEDPFMARLVDVLADTFGITVVVAAGNSGNDGLGDAAVNFNGISVANMDTRGTLNKQDDRIASSSSRGPTVSGRFKPDVAAPGTGILSATPTGTGLVRLTGTSMASPKIAGVAAVLHQGGINEPMAVRAHLINSTDTAGWQADRGWGFVNMQNARGPRSVLTSSVKAGGFVIFKGRNAGDFFTTLTWNRHISQGASTFHDLDLSVFDNAGNLIASSESSDQNVEQIAAATDGDVIVKVKAFSTEFGGNITSEKFAVSISQDGFKEAKGVALSARCTPSANTVPRGTSFNVTCVAGNSGDIAANNTEVELKVGGTTQTVTATAGNVEAGDARSFTMRLTAPAQAGTMEIHFTASATAAGEPVATTARLQIPVR